MTTQPSSFYNGGALPSNDPEDVLVLTDGTTTRRSLGARFAEVFNVKDFGAVGDGVTDDTVAIQAAIDAAEVAGGVVFFPNSNYLIGTALIVNAPGVSLVGAFATLTAKSQAWATPLVKFLDANYWHMSGFFVQGLLDSSTQTGILIDGSSYGLLERCKIFNCGGYGVQVQQVSGALGSYFNTIQNNHFYNNGRNMAAASAANIYIGTEGSETKVLGGENQACIGWGAIVNNCNGNVFMGVSLEGNAKGGAKVGVANPAEASFFGCRFEGAGVSERGILVGHATSTVVAVACHMTSNTVSDIDNTVASPNVSWFNSTPTTTPAGQTQGLKIRNSNGSAIGALSITESGGAPTVSGANLKLASSSNDLQLDSATDLISSLAAVLKFTEACRIGTAGTTFYLGGYSEAIVFDSSASFAPAKTLGMGSGTATGASPHTINQPSGVSEIAAGATAVTVNNSLVASTDRILVTPIDLDATLTSFKAVAGSGSFVVTGNAAATAVWKFQFMVIK